MPLTTDAYDNGDDLSAYTDSLIATKASRVADFDTLSFQEKAGPQFRRGQIRY
ncbi:MAG TPA: cupin domain-containing protein, partial [Streptomyces sp.]|nr:cupin domain-containing protein [Streptomyces sp.]